MHAVLCTCAQHDTIVRADAVHPDGCLGRAILLCTCWCWTALHVQAVLCTCAKHDAIVSADNGEQCQR